MSHTQSQRNETKPLRQNEQIHFSYFCIYSFVEWNEKARQDTKGVWWLLPTPAHRMRKRLPRNKRSGPGQRCHIGIFRTAPRPTVEPSWLSLFLSRDTAREEERQIVNSVRPQAECWLLEWLQKDSDMASLIPRSYIINACPAHEIYAQTITTLFRCRSDA